MDEEWKSRKAEIFEVQERNLRRAEREEHEKATAIILDGIKRFREAGIEPHSLRALPYRGSRPVKTTHVGWYLKSDRTVGIDTEGHYYILSAPGDFMTRIKGATLEPKSAPLIVGRGGRDGEWFEIDKLLELRLHEPVAPARRPSA